MRSDLTVILMNAIGNIQKEMEKKSQTDWVMNLENDCCIFSVYFLDPSNRVEGNTKVLREVNKLNKTFNVKNATIGKTVTVYLEVKGE